MIPIRCASVAVAAMIMGAGAVGSALGRSWHPSPRPSAGEAQTKMSSPAPTFAGAAGSPFQVGGDPLALAAWPGHLVASNPATGTISSFSVGMDGRLALAPGSPASSPGAPAGVTAFATADRGEIVAAADPVSNAVSAFSSDASGRLAALPGSPAPSGVQAPSVVAALRGKFISVAEARSGAVSVLALNGTGITGPVGSPISSGLSSIAALAVGDFNGDGIPDLVAAGGSGGPGVNLSILLGDGRGGFKLAPGSPFSSGGSSPGAIALEDFNDDGKTDLAVTNSSSGTVAVWLGNGDGSFRPGPGSPFPSGGSGPAGLVSADLNGDGLADLAVINSGSGSLAVFAGDGTGHFQAAPGFPTAIAGSASTAIISEDVNGDQKTDLVVANRHSQTIQVLLNTTPPPPVRILRLRLRRTGLVEMKLLAPAAGTFLGTLTGTSARTHKAVRYGALVGAVASRPGPVQAVVYPGRQGIRLFKAVKTLRLQSSIRFSRLTTPSLSDAAIPMVAASTVRRPRFARGHRHARRLIVHV